jgi:dihydrodipicolinate synthase/N-acetylneuraminate lyase
MPWHGVLVANPVAFDQWLEIDFDRYAEHIRWLADAGCDGITPNGSLGE